MKPLSRHAKSRRALKSLLAKARASRPSLKLLSARRVGRPVILNLNHDL